MELDELTDVEFLLLRQELPELELLSWLDVPHNELEVPEEEDYTELELELVLLPSTLLPLSLLLPLLSELLQETEQVDG